MIHRAIQRSCLLAAPAALGLLASAFAAGCGGGASADGPHASVEDALGATYLVGPARQYKNLGQVAPLLSPGDTVLVDGNATYPAVQFTQPGTAAHKITIRGVRVNGRRPVISGGTNAVELAGDHYNFESFDVTAAASRCIFHHADDIAIRDSVVHDCPAHGILGADADSGSLLLEYTEVYACGAGTQKHSIYMATDETVHPGSVFRMQHCYVHDSTGGNSVKSRAERNEIYYNWIEGGLYKEIELIGPDGQDEALAREDSDVVGNVFRKTHLQFVGRFGGDGTGQTWGRYRFVDNTVLLTQGSDAVFQLFDGIESVEMHNNVFFEVGGGGIRMLDDEANWLTGTQTIAGSANAVPSGSTFPGQWTGTMVTDSPGFVNVGNRDVHLLAASALVNVGDPNPAGVPGHPFPNPLAKPLFLPPSAAIEALGTGLPRPVVGVIDLGAFESGAANGGPPPPPPPPPHGGACVEAKPGQWQSTGFAAHAGAFTASVDVTPGGAALDGAVALALGPQVAWTGLAAIVRLNDTGSFDVRNGNAYGADAVVAYHAGQTYHLRVTLDVAHSQYAVFVTPPGGAEVQIAHGVSFRTAQVGIAGLDTWVVTQTGATGVLDACNLAVK